MLFDVQYVIVCLPNIVPVPPPSLPPSPFFICLCLTDLLFPRLTLHVLVVQLLHAHKVPSVCSSHRTYHIPTHVCVQGLMVTVLDAPSVSVVILYSKKPAT